MKNSGKLHIWPYVDIHGYYRLRANDTVFTSKLSHIKFSLITYMHRSSRPYHCRLFPHHPPICPWRNPEWDIITREDDNIDEAGRIDYTGWSNQAEGILPVIAGETVYLQVTVLLRSYAQGSGSNALLDFQSGEHNFIRIPQIRVQLPDLNSIPGISKSIL